MQNLINEFTNQDLEPLRMEIMKESPDIETICEVAKKLRSKGMKKVQKKRVKMVECGVQLTIECFINPQEDQLIEQV